MARSGKSFFRSRQSKREKQTVKGFSTPGKKKRNHKIILILIGGVFAAAGGFFFWMGSLQPILKSLEAQDWVEHPCIIENSYVKTHRGSDSTTYSVQVYFNYEWEGETYRGTNYTFGDFSSSGRSGKEKIVRKYPIGSESICYVNPEDPAEAVIYRDMDSMYFLIGGFTLLFIAAGAGLALFGMYHNPEKRNDTSTAASLSPVEKSPEILLMPKQKRGRNAFLAVLFAVVWNAISLLPLYFSVQEYRQNNSEWVILLIISIVSLLVGLLLAMVALYILLSLSNPLPEIRIRPGAIIPGRKYELNWSLKGSISRLEDLRLILEGTEIARYRRGTRTVTDRNVFLQETLLQTSDKASFQMGNLAFEFPGSTVPTFNATDNQILYHLICKGKIRRWPDLNETLVMEVASPYILTRT